MIELHEVTARTRGAARVDVGPMTLTLARGSSYALVGTPTDGVEAVLALIAGSLLPRSGRLRIGEGLATPGPTVAYVPRLPDLPGFLDVDELLVFASRVRGEPPIPPRERLAQLGAAPLARRRIGSLSFEEARTVALVEAITSRADLLLLADPLVDLDAGAAPHLLPALVARADAGATVIVTTASREDAKALAREWLRFERGKLVLRTTDEDEWTPLPGPRGARLFVRSEGARYLLAELAADPTIQTVRAEGVELVVTGRDPVVLAAAVAMAARRANAELDVLRFEPGDP